MNNENTAVTLSILDAFDYLYKRGLTPDALWTKRVEGKLETHATVKAVPVPAPEKPLPLKS